MAEESIGNGVLELLLLLLVSMLIGQLLAINKIKSFQVSGVATLLGVSFGGLIYLLADWIDYKPITRLNADFLFVFLLPPIIFQSGYRMDKVLFSQDTFFKQIGSISMFALFGTTLSAAVVGLLTYWASTSGAIFSFTLVECLAFGALISATDPVSVLAVMKDSNADSTVYSIIFGESILNDAAAIVLYRTIVSLKEHSSDVNILASSALFLWIFIGSILIGCAIGLIVSFVLKVVWLQNRHNFEACAVIFGPWIAYLISNACQLSGIVSILFCGIIMGRYTYPNLTQASQRIVGRSYSAVAEASELLVFIFLGMGLCSFDLPFRKMGLWTLCLCSLFILLARAALVLFCANTINVWRSSKISLKAQFFMWFAGLRGAIAFALAIASESDFENGDILLTITIVFAIVSVVVGGSFVNGLLRYLDLYAKETGFFEDRDTRGGGCLDRLKAQLLRLDEKYIYPCIVRISDSSEDIELISA